ncbi:MAG: DNA polymerase III subunit beta [Alphaproteobacteria bacterium ADurb.BinA280]|jgi:DNA polymerase-3 subunit beta|nr:DNA polymerase III subunit beta [Xanthomonadales bacterium]MCC6506244.1 DNA polymerase III subunit beta [Aquimonas sp.]OPZ13355.1 MAG: DNA polymerase III subunit beta [Alphaproteobacteria bacterium ADurb.BinA280]
MRMTLPREVLLKPLQQVVNVVERRSTMPILSNLLMQVEGEHLSLTATDLEVQMVARTACLGAEAGATTVPARKFFEIVRALPDGAMLNVSLVGDRLTVVAGRSRYTLACLAADDYPSSDELEVVERIRLKERDLKRVIDQTAFAMAQQDVRFYLNGLLLDVDATTLRAVSTDGHRLAVAETAVESGAQVRKQVIIPRKGVLELGRLLESVEQDIELEVGRTHLRVRREDLAFSTKLIDGRFPDYEAVIPLGADKEVRVQRDELRSSLQRAVILSNEKYRGVRFEFDPGVMRVVAHNPEQEEAVEEIEAKTQIAALSIGFNASYVLDALGALSGDEVLLMLRDAGSSVLLREVDHSLVRHVVMPMRL